MKIEGYKNRILDRKIKLYLENFGAVCIEGPKWCGKTWSSRMNVNSQYLMADPQGNFQNKKLAELDPSFVLKGEYPRLIDEWQEVPVIWDAIRFEVDSINEKGLFILTGSSTPNYKGVLHSGAGRIGRIKMRPMSLYETSESSGEVSLLDLFTRKCKSCMAKDITIQDIAKMIIRGGWPAANNQSLNSPIIALEYINAIIENDTQRVGNRSKDKNKLKLLLKSLARYEATTVSNNTIRKDISLFDEDSIDKDTISSYLEDFKNLFLIDNLQPFSPNVRSSLRVKQQEKRRFVDPSLACAVLNLTSDQLIFDLKTLGFLFESLCERDLLIYADANQGKVYHYQDYDNDQIDAIIEMPNGEWGAFEIKLGANQIDAAAKNLLNIKAKFVAKGLPTPTIMGVICGLSNAFYERADGIYVIPITVLKD